MLRCMACGSSICGVPCAKKLWKQHRPECRRLQAVAFGEEYARKEDRSYRMINAAFKGDLVTVKRLQIELSVAVARTKFAKAADAAMRTFLDFIDPRMSWTAAFCAAQENRLEIIRRLHEMRADLDKPNTVDGAAPASMAAQRGHTAMVQLLYDLGADVHRASNDGGRPIHVAAQLGQDKTVLLLLSLRADINAADDRGQTPLILACFLGHSREVRILLTHKCDPSLVANGGNAADAARASEAGDHVKSEILALLQQYGG